MCMFVPVSGTGDRATYITNKPLFLSYTPTLVLFFKPDALALPTLTVLQISVCRGEMGTCRTSRLHSAVAIE